MAVCVRADADVAVRVLGAASLDVSATSLGASVELRALLQDDTRRPLPGRRLQVSLLSAAANAERAAAARDCTHGANLLPDAHSQYTAESDAAGAVCIRFEAPPRSSDVEVSFTDPDQIFAPVVRRVAIEPARRALELAFMPAPGPLALEASSFALHVQTRLAPYPGLDAVASPLLIRLRVARLGAAPRLVAEQRIAPGTDAEFTLARTELDGPGPLALSAEFPGSPEVHPAHADAVVLATARVTVAPARPIEPGDPERGMAVGLSVQSLLGAVPSGSIEARCRGAIVGMGPVRQGLADVFVRLDRAQRSQPVEFRYVPDTPWWLPGVPLLRALPAAEPGHGSRLVWTAAAVALALWLFAGWRRPRRTERMRASPEPPLARAGVELVEPGGADAGWRGAVTDAHDGAPIAQAIVRVKVPSFDDEGILLEHTTGPDGTFHIQADLERAGAELEIIAPLHTGLLAAMPPPGQLAITLVSRRRALLAHFVGWAARAKLFSPRGEPTPGEVALKAADPQARLWAQAVDEAAFGPDAVSEAKQQRVLEREPRI